MQPTFLQRIYRLKVTVVALFSLGIGIGVQVVADNAHAWPDFRWLTFLPLSDIGGTLLAAGLFGIAWDYFDGRDKEEREDERIRRLLKESAPEFRDAVVEGFSVNSDDLERVATPELLDSIAVNVLALRLKNRDFAREIYEDIRDQAIRAPERWYDVNVSIHLSSIDDEDASAVPRYAVTVQWEYTVTPSHATQRFACVSDRDEFHELVSDVPATSTWFMTPRPGFDASDRQAFELLQFHVDGEPRKIRRSQRRTGQTYSVTIGDEVVRAARPVRISHVYRTITPKNGHRLYVAIAQPTKGLSLTLDYTNTDISRMSVTELISSAKRPRVTRMPKEVAAREIGIEVPGWLLPQAEVTFVWTLGSEDPTGSLGAGAVLESSPTA